MYELTVYGPIPTISYSDSLRFSRETACHASYIWGCDADVMNTETGEIVYHFENGKRVNL